MTEKEIADIVVPAIPDIDAYIIAYMAWFKELVGENVVFFSFVGSIITVVVKKTSFKFDDILWDKIRGLFGFRLLKRNRQVKEIPVEKREEQKQE